MYEKFERLIREHGVTPFQVARETGIPRSTFSDWKSGRSKPGVEKLAKLARYFGVHIEFFLEDET